MKKTADIYPVGNYKLRKVKQGVRMGINLNNNNSFGKLTTSNLNQAKATKNAGNIADTKAANAANSANTLNSATLKSNQGLKLDSNNFGKTDIRPANDNPPVAKAESEKSDDKKDKKSLGECLAEASKEMDTQNVMKDAGMSGNGAAYSGAGLAMLIVGVVKWITQ